MELHHYANDDLLDQLADLTPKQRAAIPRIVDHVYLRNLPILQLLDGPDPPCARRVYYQRGEIDAETGHWLRRPGWGHNPKFQKALRLAARLAIRAQYDEKMAAMALASYKAGMAAPDYVDTLIAIARQARLENGILMVRMTEDKDSIAAAKVLNDMGQSVNRLPDDESSDSDAADWWAAAEDP